VTIPARLALSPEDQIMGSARFCCAEYATSKAKKSVEHAQKIHPGSIHPSLGLLGTAAAAKRKNGSTKSVPCNRYARHAQHRP
jgi:hypothetical protein